MLHIIVKVLSRMVCGLLIIVSMNSFSQSLPALVIGNADYKFISKLDNSAQDARAFSALLKKRGFDVLEVLDADKERMALAVSSFIKKVAVTKKGIFYYAGHGVQIEGKNYFLHINTKRTSNAELIKNTISLQTILDAIGETKPEAIAVILDACRSSPIEQGENLSIGLGEAGQIIPKGVFVAYGASAGQSALDSLSDKDKNPKGLFTRHLLKFLSDETLSMPQVMRRVRYAVMKDALTVQHSQIPSTYDASIKEKPLLIKRITYEAIKDNLRPINARLIVPAAAGGPTDFLARQFADAIKAFNIEVNIQNVIDIVGDRVSSLEYPFDKDNVTLLMSNYPASLRREININKKFIPLGMIAETPMMLATNKQTGILNMDTLIQLTAMRKQPWRVGISGAGSQSEACLPILKNLLGSKNVVALPKQGMGPAIAEMLSGQIDLICDVRPTFEAQVKAGKLQYIASLTEEPSPDADIATAQTQGYAVVAPNWTGLFAPQGLDEDTRSRLAKALKRAVINAQFISKLQDAYAKVVSEERIDPIEVEMSLALGAEISKSK